MLLLFYNKITVCFILITLFRSVDVSIQVIQLALAFVSCSVTVLMEVVF